MAVATARRVRADRVGKDRILQTLGHNQAGVVRKMSFKLPPQLPASASVEQLPLKSPNEDDGFQIPAARDSGLKKRKAAKARVPTDLRRSASTPHLRGPALGDSGPLSPTSDKRRNKLGYHRTSVACGHCRRRKIRCLLPSPEDPQGRCTNCIRLKKDCNFYPVDQAGPVEQQSKSSLKKEGTSNAPSNSSESSPALPNLSKPGSTPDVSVLTQSPQPESDIGHGSVVPSYGGSPESGINFQPPDVFSPSGPSVWGANHMPVHSSQSQPRQLQDDPHSPYWNIANTPATSSFPGDSVLSPYGHIDASATYMNPNFGAYQQPPTTTWPPQNRSMSYSEIQGQPHQYPYHELHPQFNQQPHPSGYHFTPHPQVNHAAFSSPDPSRGMVAAPSADPQMFQRGWNVPPAAHHGISHSEQQVPVLRSTWYPGAPSYTGGQDKANNSSNPPQHYYTNVSNPG